MVNQTVVNYLRTYQSKFSLEDLKKEILSKGYSDVDFSEALASLGIAAPVPKPINPLPSSGLISEKKSSGFFKWFLVFMIFALFCFSLVVLLNFFDVSIFGFNLFTLFA
jgi:hypothetical protein